MDMDGVLVREEQRSRAPTASSPRCAATAAVPAAHQQLDLHAPRPRRAAARERARRAGGVDLDLALATAGFLEDQRPGGSAFVIGEAG
jgi:NagD protein